MLDVLPPYGHAMVWVDAIGVAASADEAQPRELNSTRGELIEGAGCGNGAPLVWMPCGGTAITSDGSGPDPAA